MNTAINFNCRKISNFIGVVRNLLVGGDSFPRVERGIHALRVRYLRARILPWRCHLQPLLSRTTRNNDLGEFLLPSGARPNDAPAEMSARSCSCPFRFPSIEIVDCISNRFPSRLGLFFEPKTGWSLPWLDDVAKFRYLILGIPEVAKEDSRGFDQIVPALQLLALRVFAHVSTFTEGIYPAPVDSKSMCGSAHCVFAIDQTGRVNQKRWRESGEEHPAMQHFSSGS